MTPSPQPPISQSSPLAVKDTAAIPTDAQRLHWRRSDLECRLGMSGAPNTSVRTLTWLIAAVVCTVGFYLILLLLPESRWVALFTERGPVPYVVMVMATWSLLMLAVKQTKIASQSRALGCDDVVPPDADFVLSPGTAARVLDRLKARCVDPSSFLLFRRVEYALSNLRNMGRIGDVDDVLNSRADADADAAESSYTLLRGLVWAIPVLGFIGTVQGLSVSLGSFGAVIQDSADFEQLKPALRSVTGGLATAFDTTLLALVAALVVQMFLTVTRKREEDLLDACNDYCQKHVVGRLRLSPFESGT